MGYKPLLLLQKEGKGKKKPKITSLTPRCKLDPLATQHLNKMFAFYELFVQVRCTVYFFQSPYSVELIVNPSLFFQHLSNIKYLCLYFYLKQMTTLFISTLCNVGYMARQSWKTRHCKISN